jgi:hypothetical protein
MGETVAQVHKGKLPQMLYFKANAATHGMHAAT